MSLPPLEFDGATVQLTDRTQRIYDPDDLPYLVAAARHSLSRGWKPWLGVPWCACPRKQVIENPQVWDHYAHCPTVRYLALLVNPDNSNEFRLVSPGDLLEQILDPETHPGARLAALYILRQLQAPNPERRLAMKVTAYVADGRLHTDVIPDPGDLN